MPRDGRGSRSSNQGSGNQLFKAERTCFTGRCFDFDGEGQGRTITSYSTSSDAEACKNLEDAIVEHNRAIHGG